MYSLTIKKIGAIVVEEEAKIAVLDSQICLSETDQECVPSPIERAMAGFGEKNMVLDGDGDAQAIYDELLLQFPKLKEAGGLWTHNKGSKTLHIIDMPQ